MIIFSGTENEKSSSFYRRNELIAHEWETLATDIHGAAEGQFNCFLVDITLDVPDDAGLIRIHGKHQLNSVTSDLFPVDSQYAGETSISTLLDTRPSGSFYIRRANLMNVLTSQDRAYAQNRDYVYAADDEALFKTIMEDHPYSPELWKQGLEYFSYFEEEGNLQLVMRHFLQDQDEIKDLMAFFKHSRMLLSHL
jgi:hypothetical protein